MKPADYEKRDAVKLAFIKAWSGYRNCSYGEDFLNPLDCSGSNWLHASLTLIDSLDTLWIMEMFDEFDAAVQYLSDNFQFHASGSVFELIIRVIGGLMSAYQFSGRKELLSIAETFADRLLPAFDTPTGLPIANIDVATGRPSTWAWAPRSTFLAHAGSLAPEMMTLAMHTGSTHYKDITDTILRFFFTRNSFNGLWPCRISTDTGLFANLDVSFDAFGDSFYEYLLKYYIMTDGRCSRCGDLYKSAIKGMKKHLLQRTSKFTYVSSLKNGAPLSNFSYLSHFIPGMIALGSQYFDPEDLELAESLLSSAATWLDYWNTSLLPESLGVKNGLLQINDHSYKLRPEFIESCFYMFRFTSNQKWRDIGWKHIQAIIKHSEVTYGFAEVRNVNKIEDGHTNVQDSYFLAETLKYAYLLFSNTSFIPLDQYVLTTEAHPLKMFPEEWMEQVGLY